MSLKKQDYVHFSLREILGTLSLSYRIMLPYDAFLRINGPLWTLSAETWLYALAGLTALAISSRSLPIAVGLAAAMAAIFFAQGIQQTLFDFVMLAGVWITGAALCIAHEIGGGRSMLRLSLLMASLSVVPLAGIWFFYGGISLLNPVSSLHARAVFVANMVLISVGMSTALCLKQYTCPRPLARTAGFSYTLYLFHFPVLILAYAIAPSVIMAFGGLAGSIAISAAASKFVEWRPPGTGGRHTPGDVRKLKVAPSGT